MDKEMMDALRADAEKLGQLTGEDHTPEFLADCEACDGKGYIARAIHVYEAGCGFSHPDVEETPCKACGGNGWFVCEVQTDALCSRCRVSPVDTALLGTGDEGHICGSCWVEDRNEANDFYALGIDVPGVTR